MKTAWSRRASLKTTAAAAVLGAADRTVGATATALPKRRLGKTGAMVSCIGFGSGTRFRSIEDEDKAQALLERGHTSGVNYFDTAGSYTRRGIERLSEKRLGEFSKPRRKEIFLATKIEPRDRDGALRSVESSLKFLQTEYLDLIQIHSLSSLADLERLGQPEGALAAIQQLKAPENRPFHRHHRPQRRKRDGRSATTPRIRHGAHGTQRGSIRNPIAQRKFEPIPAFEQSALPVALQKDIGILSMKVMGQGMLVGRGAGRVSPGKLLQLNLSQPVASVIIGREQMEPLDQNVQAAMNFKPVSESGKRRLQAQVFPSCSAWVDFPRGHEDSAEVKGICSMQDESYSFSFGLRYLLNDKTVGIGPTHRVAYRFASGCPSP